MCQYLYCIYLRFCVRTYYTVLRSILIYLGNHFQYIISKRLFVYIYIYIPNWLFPIGCSLLKLSPDDVQGLHSALKTACSDIGDGQASQSLQGTLQQSKQRQQQAAEQVAARTASRRLGNRKGIKWPAQEGTIDRVLFNTNVS